MNFNTILYRFGFDPNCFINEENEPIRSINGFIYKVRQRTDIRECPNCKRNNVYIKDYSYVEYNCNSSDFIKDTLRIKKVRFKCRECNKTFTPIIKGIDSHKRISNQTIKMICNDFTKKLTFSQIAERYNLTR